MAERPPGRAGHGELSGKERGEVSAQKARDVIEEDGEFTRPEATKPLAAGDRRGEDADLRFAAISLPTAGRQFLARHPRGGMKLPLRRFPPGQPKATFRLTN